MTELAPCPFCGGKAQRYDIECGELDDGNNGGSGIECKSCYATTALHFDRKENLASSWNERTQPRLFTGCLRDGVCRGVCRNTDCPNYDLVVAARVCVFPKEDGIVYPDTTT